MSKRYKQRRRLHRNNPFKLDFRYSTKCPVQFDTSYKVGDKHWAVYVRARGSRVYADLLVYKIEDMKVVRLVEYFEELVDIAVWGEFGAGWLSHAELVPIATNLLTKCFIKAGREHGIKHLPGNIKKIILLDIL